MHFLLTIFIFLIEYDSSKKGVYNEQVGYLAVHHL